MLYVATNGKITLLDRSRLWEYDAATYLTVTADEVGEDLMPTLGLQAIVNAATVTRERGGDAIAQDTGSITAYGKFGQTVTVALDDDAAARDLAEWIVAGYATPRPFIPNLVLDGLASSVASTVRLIDINDRVSVTSLPSQAPPDVGDLRVEGYTERIGAAGWSVECNTVPFLTLTPLVLDDATFGLLDDDNRLTY